MKKKGKNSKKALRVVLAFVFVFVIVTILTFAIPIYFLRPEKNKPSPKKTVVEAPTIPESTAHPLLLVLPPTPPAKTPAAEKVKRKVRVAIIIDDIGESIESAREIIGINAPITLSILPNLPYSKKIVNLASGLGIDVMLHMPMEPHKNRYNDTKYTPLGKNMENAEIEALTLQYIAAVPNAVGVNNHQGSSFTESEKGMSVFLHVLKEKGLFFIDSYTTPKTVGLKMAKKVEVPSAGRDVFLDNVDDPKAIMKRFGELEGIARKRGYAIAIGHPRMHTIAVLKEIVEYYQEIGIEIVPISELLKVSGRR